MENGREIQFRMRQATSNATSKIRVMRLQKRKNAYDVRNHGHIKALRTEVEQF